MSGKDSMTSRIARCGKAASLKNLASWKMQIFCCFLRFNTSLKKLFVSSYCYFFFVCLSHCFGCLKETPAILSDLFSNIQMNPDSGRQVLPHKTQYLYETFSVLQHWKTYFNINTGARKHSLLFRFVDG